MTEGINRRSFAITAAKAGAGVTALLATSGRASDVEPLEDAYEYVVIGSGAGGAPVAARLAQAGYSVLVLEAGDAGSRGDPIYDTPAYHPLSTEDERMSWNFYVQHYSERPERDLKLVKDRGGILYPRASTVGGCTAHNAMIAVAPRNRDWDEIAKTFDDESWSATRMRSYYERLERCQYRSEPFTALGQAQSRHGFRGWLPTEQTPLSLLTRDVKLAQIVAAAAAKFPAETLLNKLNGLDPNDWQVVQGRREGVYNIPMSISGGHRRGARELLMQTRSLHADKLRIRTNALAARVVFDESRRAIGVEYRDGAQLYAATPGGSRAAGTKRFVRATREVILAGGAFNSPQLLQLSGVGPTDLLRRYGIDPVVDLAGVGRNLQDHFEIGVTFQMSSSFAPLAACTFDPANDPCLDELRQNHRGIYQTSGALAGIITRSSTEVVEPDLFIFGVPGYFRGYYPGYSRHLLQRKDILTWVILKAFTPNDAGSVSLRSADPRETPDVHFRYFDEGRDSERKDLTAMGRGIDFVRSVMRSPLLAGQVKGEILPGSGHTSTDALLEYVGNEAWGHHASCSNKMGPSTDPSAVVDERFRVHGTSGLRVVDASVFPRIPGFFIVLPTYMLSEKASDVILEDARRA